MRKSTVIILVLLLTLCTCGPDVKFTEPQPQNIANLNAIPKEYYGQYKNQTDSTFLLIESDKIIQEWRSTEIVDRDSLEKEIKMKIKCDTAVQIIDKQILGKTDRINLTITLIKDSARVKIRAADILFTLSDSQLVRTYKKFCFLNYKTKDGYWLVKTLNLKGNKLDFSDLIDSKEIDEISEITKITTVKDTSGKVLEYRLSPTKRQIRRILREKKLDSDYIKQ